MILADSSTWIDHFKVASLPLSRALDEDRLLMHPFVMVELALGSPRNRDRTLANFRTFLSVPVATSVEVLRLVKGRNLFNRGIGFVDVHLLASCLLHGQCKLLTRDRRLREAAEQLGVAA